MMIKSVGKEDSNKIELEQWQTRQMVIEGKASSAPEVRAQSVATARSFIKSKLRAVDHYKFPSLLFASPSGNKCGCWFLVFINYFVLHWNFFLVLIEMTMMRNGIYL